MTTEFDWQALVEAAENSRIFKDKDVAYEFGNAREFERPQKPYERTDI